MICPTLARAKPPTGGAPRVVIERTENFSCSKGRPGVVNAQPLWEFSTLKSRERSRTQKPFSKIICVEPATVHPLRTVETFHHALPHHAGSFRGSVGERPEKSAAVAARPRRCNRSLHYAHRQVLQASRR